MPELRDLADTVHRSDTSAPVINIIIIRVLNTNPVWIYDCHHYRINLAQVESFVKNEYIQRMITPEFSFIM